MAIVTIGIPVYNEEKYLKETIESAISQSLTDIEIIISDNTSTDSSYDIANKCAKNDSRVRVVRQEENIGPLNNFRFLLDEAKSPYFVWLGGHDLFEEDYLEKAVEFLYSDEETVMVYPQNAIFVDVKNKYLADKACSNINTTGIKQPLKRVKHIVEKLRKCTNIHGVFRTKVLMQLPFENIIGPDNLLLAAAGVLGKICDIDTIGIRRRKLRVEDSDQQKIRWEKIGIYRNVNGVSPYHQLVRSHLRFVISRKEVKKLDLVMNYYSLRKVLRTRYYLDRVGLYGKGFNIATTALDSKTKTLGLSHLGFGILKSPGLLFTRPVLGALRRILFTKNR